MSDLADLHIEQARSRSAAATATLAVWLAALASVWLLALVPKLSEITTLRNTKEKLATLKTRGVANVSIVNEKVSQQNAVAKVAFKVPGFEFEVPTAYASTVWNLLALFLVLYVFHARGVILNAASKAIRLRTAPGSSPAVYADVLSRAPWWLAPLPFKRGVAVSATEVEQLFGWNRSRIWNTWILTIALIAIVAIEIHVTWIGYLARRYIRPSSGLFQLSNVADLLIIALTGSLCWRWLSSSRVPDCFPDEPALNPMNRRQVLGYASFIVSAGLLAPAIALLGRPPRQPRQPRFRSRSRVMSTVSSLTPGYYENPKTRIIHVVTPGGRINSSESIRVDRLSAVSASTVKTLDPQSPPRVHLVFAGNHLEHEARQSIEKQEYEDACAWLLAAIKHDSVLKARVGAPYSIRLYELLAGVALRYSQQSYFSEVVKLARGTRSEVLMNRAALWSSADSGWRRRWSDKSKELEWAGLLM